MPFFSFLIFLMVGQLALLFGGAHLPLSPVRAETPDLLPLLLSSLPSLLGSLLVCHLIKHFEPLHRAHTFDNQVRGVQKIHDQPVPRIGGVAIMAGLLLGLVTLCFFGSQEGIGRPYLGLLLLSALTIFLGGLAEDLTKQVSVRVRLVLAFISAGLGAYLLQALVPSLGLPWLDRLVDGTPLIVLFTVFAVGGVTHSFNLIDGLNGLLGGVTLIVLSALLLVAYHVGDYSLFMLGLFVMMATLGFLIFNWPGGRIFAGDGGAYLLGYLSATLFVLLVARNPEVSPWFPLVTLGYPVFETLFSIYRRRFFQHVRYDAPDDLHLHQLIYRLLSAHRKEAGGVPVSNNSLAVLPIWLGVLLVTLTAAHYFANTHALMWIFLLGIVAYKLTYRALLFLVNRVELIGGHHPKNGD